MPADEWKFNIPIIYSGIGKINAPYSTFKAINRFAPDLIINLGSVGTFDIPIGTTLEISDVVERDFNSEPLAARGIVPFDSAPNTLKSITPGYKCGTGDCFVINKDPWLISNRIDVVDMELFSIAKICFKLKVNWMSGKYVSDQIGLNSSFKWQVQINFCSPNLIIWFEENFLN